MVGGDDVEEFISFIKDTEVPFMEYAGTYSSKVRFILSGQIHIMDRYGMYDYGVVSEGGYFGEISVLLDEPAEFSYMFNPHSGKPLLMLTLSTQDFIDIIDKFPEVKE